jgi:hypothetical protein
MADSYAKFALTDKVTVQNTIVETNLLPGTSKGSRDFLANTLAEGDVIIARAWGTLDTKATGPGNLTFKLWLPHTEAVSSIGPRSLGASWSGVVWQFYHMITVRVEGAEGRITTWGGLTALDQPSLNKQGGIGQTVIDTTDSNSMQMSVLFTVADLTNKLVLEEFSIEVLPAP